MENAPLALSLCLVNIIAPDVNTMSSNQHGIRVGMFLHGSLQVLSQILLVGSILNNGDSQRIVISQVARLGHALAKTLDLLNVVNLKDLVLAGTLGLEEQRHQHSPLGVGVDAAAGVAACEGGEEEGSALRGFVDGGRAEVDSALKGGFLCGEGEDVDVRVLHEFLLDAGGGEIHEVTAYVSI